MVPMGSPHGFSHFFVIFLLKIYLNSAQAGCCRKGV